MIELVNVSKYYNANGITNLGLHNISLKLSKNEIVAITGDSGSGKSTLLNVITKIDTFDDGEIYYKGNETSYFETNDMDNFRKNKVGFIFQNYNILDSYTVLENVMLPLLLKGESKRSAKQKAINIIDKVGLKGKEKNRGSKLSGGEKQRCVIARALASECEILACDEPTGNLDSVTGKEIIELISSVAKDKLVLIVTHNFDEVKDIVTRQIKVSDGEIVEDIKYKNIPDDENEELNLDYKPLKKHIDFSVSRKNVLFTPRKTILVALIFFFICFFYLMQIQIINGSAGHKYISNSYLNRSSDRLVVYKDDYSKINLDDINSLNKEYFVNPFYEDRSFEIYEKDNSYSSPFGILLFCRDSINYTLQKGRRPQADGEFVLIYPEYFSEKIFENQLNKEFSFEQVYDSFGNINNNNTSDFYCKLVGYGVSKDCDTTLFIGSNALANYINNKLLSFSFYHNNQLEYISKKFSNTATGTTLYLPTDYKDDKVELLVQNLYVYDNIRIEYKDGISPELVINPLEKNNMDAYMVSVYSNSVNLSKRKLEKMGYMVDIPSKLSEDDSLSSFIENLTLYVSTFFLLISIIVVFFITYIIISRIYQSKIKDYEILRTLGITKNDMRYVVYFEIGIIGIISLVIAIISVVLLLNFVDDLEEYNHFNFVPFCMYIITIFIFYYGMAKRFNNKLFKFSVSKSLKGGFYD